MSNDDNNNSQTILNAGTGLAGVAPRVMYLAHPEDPDTKIPVSLDESGNVLAMEAALAMLDGRMPGPLRREGTLATTEVESFIAALKRWGGAESVVYANTASFGFTAVLDDHPVGHDAVHTAWRKHRITYSCPRSPEWKAWTDADGRAFSQTQFADFIEQRLEDMIGAPDMPRPTDVLVMARQLLVKSKGTYQREFDPTTGDNILISKTETETGSTQIYRAFMIAISVFEGGDRYQIEARVRFALEQDAEGKGKPVFRFMLHRRPEIERDAFAAVRKQVTDATGYQLIAGTP